MTVADLRTEGPDPLGDKVLVVYGLKPPEYAVYGTSRRVAIQFSDDAAAASRQRRALAPLNPLRGEINGLIDGWRSARRLTAAKSRANRYDRRVADALVVALEDDVAGAEAHLRGVKDDIFSERTAWARLEYLLAALALSLVCLIASVWLAEAATSDLWRAASAGAVGAFFSIALGIRGRTVLTDLQRTSNLTDACIRVVIGFVAASVLMALVESHAVTVAFGDARPDAVAGRAWLYALIVGFVAGFSERLVPDLLEKGSAPSSTGATAATGAAVRPALPPAAEAKPPAPVAPQQEPSAADAPAGPADPAPAEAGLDHCLCDVDHGQTDATPDIELPGATGGVAAELAEGQR